MKATFPLSRTTQQALLILLCALLFLPGLTSLPPFDRDEARFAQASKQMLESGDYVDIRFQEQVRYKKPVGIHWLQAFSARLAGPDRHNVIWPYRLPSLLGAILAVLLTLRIGALLFQPAVGLLGALILAFTLLLNAEARLAKTDAMLLACVLGVQYLLALAYRHGSRSWRPGGGQWLGGWLALAAGLLVKGPAILVITGLTVAGLAAGLRDWRWLSPLRPLRGTALVLLIILPWLIAIMWRSEGRFLADALCGDILSKVLSGQESHGAPPGTHFIILWAAFWPGSLLLSLALPWVWRHRDHRGVRFCLAWILPAWLLFELIPTKLPHYLLPVYPALALLAARAWLSAVQCGPGGYRRMARWLWIAGGALPPLLVTGAYFFLHPDATGNPLSLLALAAAAASAASALVFGIRPGNAPTLGLLLAGTLLFYTAAFQWLLPAMQPLWPSRTVVHALERLKPETCPEARLLSLGYQEPSLVFLAGTDTVLLNDRDPRALNSLAAFLAQRPCNLALVPGDRLEHLMQHGAYQILKRIQGVNYSNGRALDLYLVDRAGSAHPPPDGE